MPITYNYNPFEISARIYQIVWRVVHATDEVLFNAEEVLEGGPPTPAENHWDTLHEEDPDKFLEFIQHVLSRARSELEQAQLQNAEDTCVAQLQKKVELEEARLRKAIDLNRELKIEAAELRANSNNSSSGLKLSPESMGSNVAPQFILHTVYDYLVNRGIADIREWARPDALLPRRERRYTTTLLNVLDATIVKFYENFDPNRPPTNAAIEAWIKSTFPQHEELLSQKVIDAMFQIRKEFLLTRDVLFVQ